MTAIERQVSWGAGELAPGLWGRTDLVHYPVGARTLRNWIVTQHAVLVNRPGTQHISKISAASTRRAMWYFDGVGDAPGAVIVQGGRVEDGSIYGRIASVWVGGQFSQYALPNLRDLAESLIDTNSPLDGETPVRSSQAGNIMTFTPSMVELQRNPDTLAFEFLGIRFQGELEHQYGNYSPYDVDTDYPALQIDGAGWSTDQLPNRIYGLGGQPPDQATGALEVRPVEWRWMVSRVMRRPDGTAYETVPRVVTQTVSRNSALDLVFATAPSAVAVYPDWTQRLRLGKVAPGTSQTRRVADGTGFGYFEIPEDRLDAYRIYRGRGISPQNGLWGFVGQTADQYFNDDGGLPDYANPPRLSRHPGIFRCVAHFGDRRYFARRDADGRTMLLEGSAIGQYHVFDEVERADDADALAFDIIAKRGGGIVDIVPQRALVVLATSGIWVVSGSGLAEVITPNSRRSVPVSTRGASEDVPAVEIGETIVFASRDNRSIRSIVAAGDGERVSAPELSTMASHLFESSDIAGWVYASHPFSVLWVWLEDGTLLSLTYVEEQNINALTRHEIAGGGKVRAMAVDQSDEDRVYLLVEYEGEGDLSLERFAPRTVGDDDVRDGVFLDRSVSHAGRLIPTSGYAMVVGDAGAVGETLSVTFHASVASQIAVGSVVQADDPEGGAPYKFLVTADGGGGAFTVQVRSRDVPGSLVNAPLARVYVCAATVTGLGHLEGQTVSALKDGDVVEGLLVEGGSVSFGEDDEGLTNYGAVIHVGLGYVSDFESLDAIGEKGRQKQTKSITIELENSRGAWVGATLEQLEEVVARMVEDGFGPIPLRRQEVAVPVSDTWAPTGRCAVRQSAPLPCTVLGVTREIEYGGR